MKTRNPFILDLFMTRMFDAFTRDGLAVEICGIETEAEPGHEIVGWLTYHSGAKVSQAWDLQGKVTDGEFQENVHDFFLEMK